jgi:hypothetical protein
MYRIGHDALGQRVVSTLTSTSFDYQFDWQLVLYHKDGGYKKSWWIGQDDTPIESIKFELNKHICGAGTINFVFLDFTIDADDYVELYYQGDLKYRAIVDVTVDPKGGQVKLIPYATRFSELLYSRNYVNRTVEEMLKILIENQEPDTDIIWNADFIDTGNTDTFSKNYTGYATPRKVIDENVANVDDREWGVTALNIFTVYANSTTADKILFYGDDPAYASIERKEDLRQVKATRYQVLRKVSGTGETKRLGFVGSGGSYPVLDIEKRVRKKVTKYTVSELVSSDTQALEIAYANLQAQAVVPEIIKVKELRIDKYFPVIGQKITVQDSPEYISYTIIHCDSLTDDDESLYGVGQWNGATLETSDFVEGTASVKFTSGDMGYSFDEEMRLFGDEKLGFMIKGTVAGDYITLKLYTPPEVDAEWGIGVWGENAWGVSSGTTDDLAWGLGAWGEGPWGSNLEQAEIEIKIQISTSQVWEFKQISLQGLKVLSKVEFSFNDATSSTVKVDRIELFGLHRNEYTANIIQANFDISSNGTKCDLVLNDYDIFANDEDFANQRKLEILEAISQNT